MLFFSYRETLPYFTSMAVMGTCRPQCQNCQASVHGVRGNGNYLLEAHSCQYMHHFSTHYSIQVALPPTLLGKLKIEPKNTFHTLFWLLGAASRRGCLSWNNWICLLRAEKNNNAGRAANPTICCPLKQKYIWFLHIHCVLKTPFPTSYFPLPSTLSSFLHRALLSLLPPTIQSILERSLWWWVPVIL